MDAAAWDERYDGHDLVWGTEPNRFVASELGGLRPGRALDLACGEGRNAIWLATRGWDATGVDFSTTAIERARRLAEDAGVGPHTRFVVGDVVAGALPPGPFDVVVVAYLQLPEQDRRRALRSATQALAAGGTLLVVAHDSANVTGGCGGPQDPRVLYGAEDVVADLDGLDVAVDRAEQVRRPVQTDEGERDAIDVLVRVHRSDARVGT